MFDTQRSMESQGTAVWSETQVRGDELSREGEDRDGCDYYWNYVDE